MTVLPYLDIKATPIYSVVLPQSAARSQSFSRISDVNGSSCSSYTSNKSLLSSSSSHQIPKIKILARSDEKLKQLPYPKPPGAHKHNAIWKPLIRESPDYDYLWEPLQRENIRHQYDYYQAPERILASLPDPPNKMTSVYETEDRQYHNAKRVRAMQQKQWNKEHMQYTIYPYAHMIERELYK